MPLRDSFGCSGTTTAFEFQYALHLGATINFQAGTVKRAPYTIQKLGLEWLWRIKEEPYLWRRYFHDGSVLLNLLLDPRSAACHQRAIAAARYERSGHDLVIEQSSWE